MPGQWIGRRGNSYVSRTYGRKYPIRGLRTHEFLLKKQTEHGAEKAPNHLLARAAQKCVHVFAGRYGATTAKGRGPMAFFGYAREVCAISSGSGCRRGVQTRSPIKP